MSVRFDADGEQFSRTGIGLASDTVPWSYGLWVKRVVDRGTFSACFSLHDGTTGQGEQIATNSGGDIATSLDINGSDSIPGPTYVNDQWVYLAVSNTGSVKTFYWRTDAEETLSSAQDTNISLDDLTGITQLFIGDVPWSNQFFNGSECCARLWSEATSEADFLDESNSEFAIKTTNLEGDWRLETATDTTDYSGNGRTLSGGTGATTDADEPTSIAPVSTEEEVSFSLDSRLVDRNTVQFQLDLLSVNRFTSDFNLEALLEANQTKELNLDALLKAEQQLSFSLDSMLNIQGGGLFSLDAILKGESTTDFLSDAVLKSIDSEIQFGMDVQLVTPPSASFSIDHILKAPPDIDLSFGRPTIGG